MAWGAQTWLRFTKEASYGTRPGAPAGSDVIWIRLYTDNAFTMRPVPQRQIIRTADAGNRRRQVVAGRKAYSGALNTLLYPTQAGYLIDAATKLTTNELDSYCVDFFDSVRVQGYLGCKVQSLTIASAATQDYVTLSLNLIAQQLDASLVALTQPADTVFPTEIPYEHIETSGQVSIGAGVISKYSSLNVTFNNVLTPTWDELAYISGLYYCGRDVDFSLNAQYSATTWRTAYEAQSPLAATLKWNRVSPAKSVTLDCKSKNYTATIADSLPLGGVGYQQISFQTFFDATGTTDLAVTVV